jgi:hypothetical protein
VASLLAADIHRARSCLVCTASLLLDADLRIEKPFPLSSFTFVPDNEGKYIEGRWKHRIISQVPFSLSTARAQVVDRHEHARCITAVNNLTGFCAGKFFP